MQPSSGGGASSSSTNPSGLDPMDIDPIDGGPKPQPQPLKATPAPMSLSNLNAAAAAAAAAGNTSTTTTMNKEEEARQAIDMLRGDDLSARVSAAHRLDAVALALGEERTREELLPFVSDGVDDEDEVLLAMALSLGRMIDAVGGPTQAHVLLRPLELLLTVEETSVREAAAISAQKIADCLGAEQFQNEYSDMLGRLATKEWFTARLSSAGLIAAAYPRLTDPEKQQLHLDNFAKLCQDDTPMVRRVAAQYLGQMVRNVVQVHGREALSKSDSDNDENDAIIPTQLLPLYEQLASNDQPDSVRLQTSENCVALGQVMSDIATNEPPLRPSELQLLQRVLPLIVATIDDRSWRVRWTAAAKFALVIQAYDNLPSDAMDSLVPAYEKLLQDPEAEVRTAATLNLAQVAKCQARVPLAQHPSANLNRPTPPQDPDHNNAQQQPGGDPNNSAAVNAGPRVSVAERLVKKVTTLTEDDSEHVRAALAMVATELAPVLGRDATITYLVPPVLLLLRDAASEVRLNLISSLSSLNEVMGVDLLSQSLLPAILDLAQDGKWRIRLAIIQHIPLLAKQLGKDFFTEKLVSLCVGWLGDDIACIRTAAAENLKHLTALFGAEWAIDNLIPSILVIKTNDSYLRRLTALQACSMMATEMSSDVATCEMLPLVLEMATDVVANIRFNVAKELQLHVAPVCSYSTYETQIVPVLTMLMNDDDRDVRYYAEKSLSALEERFAEMEE